MTALNALLAGSRRQSRRQALAATAAVAPATAPAATGAPAAGTTVPTRAWLPGEPVPGELLEGPNQFKVDAPERAGHKKWRQFYASGVVPWPYGAGPGSEGVTVPLDLAFGQVPCAGDASSTVALPLPPGVFAGDVCDEKSATELLLADGRVLSAHLELDMGVNKTAGLPNRALPVDDYLPFLRLSGKAHVRTAPDLVSADRSGGTVAVGEVKWGPSHRSTGFAHRQVLLPALAARTHFGADTTVVPVFVLATGPTECLVATVEYPGNDLPGATLGKVTRFVFT